MPKGKWLVGQLRWDTFARSYYGYQLEEFSPEQIRWMRTFATLYAAEATTMPYTHLPLEHFDSPLLWQLLAQGMSGTIFGKLGLEDDPDVNRRVLAVLLDLDGADS